MNPRIKKINKFEDFKIEVVFTNDEIGVFDCTPYLDIGVFKELKNKEYFKQAKVEDGTVVWPKEQDFCPDTVYKESQKVANENQSTRGGE